MSVKDELGTRMKEFYEQIPKMKLMRRTPVAIRIDGKAFHTFTRGFKKPFDDVFMASMQKTMLYLCENIQGCVFGYTQSDEITLILIDYKKINSDAWFDYEVQKMCSIAASMATMYFNKAFSKEVENLTQDCEPYKKALEKGAMFDARCFNIPKEEVANLIYWRQLDAMRNSVQMLGRSVFSNKELYKKSCNDIKEMLKEKEELDWNEMLPIFQRGCSCIRDGREWKIDYEMPIIKGENREYIEKLIYVQEE